MDGGVDRFLFCRHIGKTKKTAGERSATSADGLPAIYRKMERHQRKSSTGGPRRSSSLLTDGPINPHVPKFTQSEEASEPAAVSGRDPAVRASHGVPSWVCGLIWLFLDMSCTEKDHLRTAVGAQ